MAFVRVRQSNAEVKAMPMGTLEPRDGELEPGGRFLEPESWNLFNICGPGPARGAPVKYLLGEQPPEIGANILLI